MAVSTVILGIWNSNKLQRFKIENVDFSSKVEVFKSQAFQQFANISRHVEFSFCGVILENDNTLSSYGVTPGVTIHLLDKQKHEEKLSGKKMSEYQVVNSFGNLALFPGYRAALQRLSKKEVVDKITEATPGLQDDPAALAIIQDPELVVYLSDSDTVDQLAKKHPKLLDAASNIITYIHEEQANANPNQASTSTGYSYSLEALSDDEDDDDEDMDPHSDANIIAQNSISRNASFNAITAAQLAAAIANATDTQFNTNSAGIPATPTSTGIITNEMFSNAIQKAFSLRVPNAALSLSMPTTTDEENLRSLATQWESQLQKMHEMGMIDDNVNIRALRTTNGDVNAAMELVLSIAKMSNM